jgi:anti-anti-sigma regulatory factor
LLDAVSSAPVDVAIVVDLTELTSIDSQGLTALVMCHRAARVSGRPFLVRGATGQPAAAARVARCLDP